ncbi:Glutamate racemase 1 [Kingella kingae]|uniref:glutamate racemase n=1 Tax=Kingella kingae TaxID=504 RepID=UPI00041859F2|nr:glutamate racemase [Kingella kingae]MDK4591750.1 glutamate racemase [Kingella kingae]MDK4596299.1 glutamate racemase [Kingella kingae]MDK4600197.1 glutamate racemase [Kingella kingae]MDK4643839.1 glutamate racemase [Kingella kingae]MDK4652090.1 glutamate racemase [Kingella kingae]
MNNQRKQKPIGVFDSGVGGLTVVRALMERLPNENIVYFGDTARVPYGVKSRNTIEEFTTQIVEFLLQNEVKALVIACNTIAAVAYKKVQQIAGNIPVLSVIEAGAQAALATTRNNHIGVIATSTTVNSNAYARAIHAQNPDTRILSQATPLLVPLVEEGWLDHEVTRLTIHEYLKPLLADQIDTLILGCTHFPLLKAAIKHEAPHIELVDSSTTTAEATAQALADADLLNPSTTAPDYRFYVSDIPLRFQTIGERFLGRSLEQIEMMRLG